MIYVKYRGKKFKIIDGKLDLSSKEIRDINEIKNLENLRYLKFLNLKNNKISEIDGLESLVHLEVLNLQENQINVISGLETLTHLENLNLQGNQINVISGLETLIHLEILNLRWNQIEAIKGLEKLTHLDILNLRDNQIKVISGLESLKYLQDLSLRSNYISEISGLENLINLTSLDLKRNFITEIKGLETLKNLKILNLNFNNISEIKGLEKLTNLKSLNLRHNHLLEIKGIKTLVNLESLDLRENNLSEIKGLETLKNLRELFIDKNSKLLKISNNLGGINEFGKVNKPQKFVIYSLHLLKNQLLKKIKRIIQEYYDPSMNYQEIPLKKIYSKINLKHTDIEKFIKEMITNGQIRAQFKRNSIIFKKEESSVSTKSEDINTEGFNIFLSHSNRDFKFYRISDIAHRLQDFKEIKKVYYWQESSGQNIVDFMEKSLNESQIFILFCSENALKSESVKGEWHAAYQLKKDGIMKIIPVYTNEEYIPKLLRPMLNVKFIKESFKVFINKLYNEIYRDF